MKEKENSHKKQKKKTNQKKCVYKWFFHFKRRHHSSRDNLNGIHTGVYVYIYLERSGYHLTKIYTQNVQSDDSISHSNELIV